ncbi:MAG: hypothetical protein ACRCST_07305 [Turicibacter sp.]
MNQRTGIKIYNLIFPIWLLWLFPMTWLIVFPANFIIDLLVIFITLYLLKIKDIKKQAMAVIFKVWVFGFIADFIGTLAMLFSTFISFDYETELGQWWYKNISNAISYQPFESIYSTLWVTACVIITACFIYWFNYSICFKSSDLTDQQKKIVSLCLAIFTAPYLFYLPTAWFF